MEKWKTAVASSAACPLPGLSRTLGMATGALYFRVTPQAPEKSRRTAAWKSIVFTGSTTALRRPESGRLTPRSTRMSTAEDARTIRILCVDDHQLLREGIAAVVEGQPDMRLVGEATNGQEAIESFRRLRPDVTLMDLR